MPKQEASLSRFVCLGPDIKHESTALLPLHTGETSVGAAVPTRFKWPSADIFALAIEGPAAGSIPMELLHVEPCSGPAFLPNAKGGADSTSH